MTESRAATYEHLRAEWINTHKNHTELELLMACKTFAKDTGLVVRQSIYQKYIDELTES